jgi:hypothetical protein
VEGIRHAFDRQGSLVLSDCEAGATTDYFFSPVGSGFAIEDLRF